MSDAPLERLVANHFGRIEIALLARALVTTLAGALPASVLEIERRRTLADRLAGRPEVITGVTVTTPRQTLTLHARDIGDVEAVVSHVVRGVVLSRRTVPVAEWIELLGVELDRMAAEDERTRAALQRVLR